LVEAGYAASSTNAIARRAGVSIGSVYQYFGGKEDVFRAVVRRHRAAVKPLVASSLARMAEPENDWIEVVLDLLRSMARVNADHPRLMAAIERELGWLEHDDDEEFVLSEQVAGILRLRTTLPPRERAVNARLLIVALVPLSRWLVHSKPRELDTELFVKGVGKMLHGLVDE
jgi:AcrR family transcriptional regulator